jgi:hypothetical protein
MEGWTDNTHDDAFTHTVRLHEPGRAVEVLAVALPSPSYEIREARGRVLEGDVAPEAVGGLAALAGVRMVGGLTRRVGEATGRGPGAAIVRDAVIEIARLARQVAKLPAERAARAASGDPWECWQLDTSGWVDLPDSCFTYSDAGRALFGTRPITSPMQPALYSPAPGQRRVFERRKTARLERVDGRLRLVHHMFDNAHGFEITYEVDEASGRIVRAESVTPRLPYMGVCSEPQGKIQALVGEVLDARLGKRIQLLLGGPTGCAQLYDLTADLLRVVAAEPAAPPG